MVVSENSRKKGGFFSRIFRGGSGQSSTGGERSGSTKVGSPGRQPAPAPVQPSPSPAAPRTSSLKTGPSSLNSSPVPVPAHSSPSQFNSDISNEHKPFTRVLVSHHERGSDFEALYDSSRSWELGRGGYGSVTTVTKRVSGETFAVKTVCVDEMDANAIEELRNEIEIQCNLSHPNIVRLYESFEQLEEGKIHIVMEMCLGGSLVSRMKNHRHGYGEQQAATLVEKMLSAVLYCHKHGVVHRDIKLDNFIYETEEDDAELKLIDFGFACEVQSGAERMYERLGTLSYMAPELVSPERRKSYDSSVDMWALGVLTYMLLSGKRPFHHPDRKRKIQCILNDPVNFDSSDWASKSAACKEFCLALLQKEPSKRLSASDAIKHPWIQNLSSLHERSAAQELVGDDGNDVVSALQSYQSANELKRLALEIIAFSIPPTKLEELRRLFVEMDTDDSGTISREEFRNALSSHPEIAEKSVDKIFDAMDMHHAGQVDYGEFLAATLLSQKQSISKPSVANAFTMLDTDHDGYITRNDMLGLLGEDFSAEDIDKMISQATTQANHGKRDCLSFDDFKFLMLKGNDQLSQAMYSMASSSQRLSGEPSQ